MNGFDPGVNQAMQQQEVSGYLGAALMASVPTIAQRLDLAVKQAEERLAAVKRARELFEKNPDLKELLDIMQRAPF